jgi:hypothetical protein
LVGAVVAPAACGGSDSSGAASPSCTGDCTRRVRLRRAGSKLFAELPMQRH